jgi:hypothetical protein
MLHALASGETDRQRLADLAKKQLRSKIPALRLALDGCLLPHHRFLLGEMLQEPSHIQSQLTRLDSAIESQMQPFQKALPA